MDEPQIRFDDGAAYEDFMGRWSRLAGEVFLDWLAPPDGLRWIDVGCGNGAFTELLVTRCAPLAVRGVDPSEAQIAYACERLAGSVAEVTTGDAMALPFADASADAAVMALVIFFAPDPARGVAEMARVVAPGGSVSAYAWDLPGGGFPFAALYDEMTALGAVPLWPPHPEVSRIDALAALWAGAGLQAVETREIAVTRRFDDFDAFWHVARNGPRLKPKLESMAAGDLALLQRRVRDRLPTDDAGRIVCTARANAVKGRVPGGPGPSP